MLIDYLRPIILSFLSVAVVGILSAIAFAPIFIEKMAEKCKECGGFLEIKKHSSDTRAECVDCGHTEFLK